MDPRDVADEEAQERDLWWGAPSSRSMIPSMACSAMLTAIIVVGAWYMYRVRPTGVHWWRYGGYVLGLLLWAQQLVRWLYRAVFVNYRLTTCRLWRDSGFRRPSRAVIDLANVKDVRVEPPTRRERVLRLGRVRVRSTDPNPGEILLFGLPHPEQVAEAIRAAADRATTAAHSGRACPPP